MFLELSAIRNLFAPGNCQAKRNANKQLTWVTNTQAVSVKILWDESWPLSPLFSSAMSPSAPMTSDAFVMWHHTSSNLCLSHLPRWLIITPGRKTLLFSCWNTDFFNKLLIWVFNFCRREQGKHFAIYTMYYEYAGHCAACREYDFSAIWDRVHSPET